LGTDGAASNDSQDMLGALKSAALLQKVVSLDATALRARDVIEATRATLAARESELASARVELSREKLKKLDGFRLRFQGAVDEDMGLPQAIAVVWEMLKSNIPDYDKLDALLDWDQVLGLNLANVGEEEVPEEVRRLGAEREALRVAGRYVEADHARMAIEKVGWEVRDTSLGPKFSKIKVPQLNA